MIIGGIEEVLVRIYRCHLCGQRWLAQAGSFITTCAVAHAPGTSCHYAETMVSDEQMEKILAALKPEEKP